MKTLQQFISELKTITKKLNTLQDEYAEIYKQYEGVSFDMQTHCSSVIENLITMLTHEIESEMAFGLIELEEMIHYINFRKEYNEYTNAELLKIIDDEALKAPEKLKIINHKKFKNLQQIKSHWNNLFKKNSYKSFISKRLKIVLK